MQRLRREEAVAVLGKDKHGRFGILVPMESSADGGGTGEESDIAAGDCAAFCYIGEVQEVVNFLSNSTSGPGSQGVAPTVETGGSGSSMHDSAGLWQPPGTGDEGSSDTGLWQPPGTGADVGAGDPSGDASGNEFSAPWDTGPSEYSYSSEAPWGSAAPNGADPSTEPWEATGYTHDNNDNDSNKRSFESMNGEHDEENDHDDKGETFHSDTGAAAADAFYSGLTRSLDTRADSFLYHMRAFNGWVKATQIQELDPRITVNGKPQGKSPLRVLDLACGKGGDLTKWTLHDRGMSNYVGIDVARGSLRDAAIRAREMRKRGKLKKAIFTCADLGADVPGRRKSPTHRTMQKLLTWSLEDEAKYETDPPEFKMRRGGGISEMDRFDVVSIQFAIHYMMSSGKRARRFFHTVSELLEIGGNLVCTTIDARVVIGHFMDLGLDYHFVENGSDPDFEEAVVEAGGGACKIKFEPEVVRRILTTATDGTSAGEELFGLQYTFTLVEGSDHAAGVGDAVNLPEWLTPIPVLEALGNEAGLELEYAQNFHEFFETRKDATEYPAAHHALYNMKVLNRDGSISKDEWSVSRLYAAIKFRKVRESTITLERVETEADEVDDTEEAETAAAVELDPIKAKKLLPVAMVKAKRKAGEGAWKALSSEEKKRLTQRELEQIAAK